MQFWNELEGQVLDGFPLRRLVRSEGRSAWFETESREGGVRPATISLTESLTDAEEITQRLRAARRIQHPHLAAIGKIGQARLDRTLFVYAVMEHAEQNLSDILRDRTLSPAEARQVAEATVGALTEIHRRGLAHGRVEPASVLAIGDAVKLRSDCLPSPGATRAGDIAGIGATLFEALAQRKASLADGAQIDRIPAPFAEIVRNSLSSRWNLAQIAAALSPPPMPAPIAVPGREPPAPPAKPSSARSSAPITPIRRRLQEEDGEQDRTRFRAALPYIALAVVILLVLTWLVFRPKAGPRQEAARAQAASHAAPAKARLPAAAPIGIGRAGIGHGSIGHTRPVRAAPGRIPVDRAAAGRARTIWHVVAYTYLRQDQAQHKADEVNHAHSALQASVFLPKGESGPYLVILGGAMDRAHAFALRDEARRLGLPSDTYAQNFSR